MIQKIRQLTKGTHWFELGQVLGQHRGHRCLLNPIESGARLGLFVGIRGEEPLTLQPARTDDPMSSATTQSSQSFGIHRAHFFFQFRKRILQLVFGSMEQFIYDAFAKP